MKIFLKSIIYSISILIVFWLLSFAFPTENYDGASPSEDFIIKQNVQIFLFSLVATTIFVMLFYREFNLRKQWSIIICIFLHFIVLILTSYFSMVIIYDFLLENYPDIAENLSEKDAYNDISPSASYGIFVFIPSLILGVWICISVLKKWLKKK